MADDTPPEDALDLRDERPEYVEDQTGEVVDGEDLSEDVQPSVGTDPQDTGDTGIDKPTVKLDDEAVRRAEAEGKGYA